jgi:hypothetical protein
MASAKNPKTERWGGPGASHEDRSKPMPPKDARPAPADHRSHVSGGGGERDVHHTHIPTQKG